MTTLKLFAAACMASTLLAVPAMAQSNPPAQNTTPQAQSTTPPARSTTTPQAKSTEPAAQSKPMATEAMKTAPGAQAGNKNMQEAGEWRGSKLIGLAVYNANNEKIGDINELIVNKDGKINVVVIGVGGFLGIGEHNVGLALDQVKFVDEPVRTASSAGATNTAARPATTGAGATTASPAVREYPDHAMVNMTKEQLKALPAFKYASEANKNSNR